MLCSKHFSSGMFAAVVNDKQNCSRCGKTVCESCSQARHRLSKIEKKKYRVCDACEMILLNYKLDQLWAREVNNRAIRREDMKDAIRDTIRQIKLASRDAKDLESLFQQKQKDVKQLQHIRVR